MHKGERDTRVLKVPQVLQVQPEQLEHKVPLVQQVPQETQELKVQQVMLDILVLKVPQVLKVHKENKVLRER